MKCLLALCFLTVLPNLVNGEEVALKLEDTINPMYRVIKAPDITSWLNRDTIKKNQTMELLGEIQQATGEDKAAGAICMMKIYIQPPSAPPKSRGAKPTSPQPAPKPMMHSFPVFSDNKALGAYMKVLFSANLVPTVTLQGKFEETDGTHKNVEEWKRFKADKFLYTSSSLAQARQANKERETKTKEIMKQIADDMKGPVPGLNRNNLQKKQEPPKPQDKNLIDEEK